MQKTAMNPNPEQEMAVNCSHRSRRRNQPVKNAQTYPVEGGR